MEYEGHEAVVARLAAKARHHPLTPQEQDKLMRELAMMRMVCDTNYILNSGDKTCPKLAELEKILDDCRLNQAKVIVFSEWERMLELAQEFGQDVGAGRIVIRQKIGQSDLAAMAGIARENVSRILNDWKRRKLVSRLSGYYCLENKAQLEHEAEL